MDSKNINLKMVVEIPFGSSNKYEFNQFNKTWKLDRVLHGSNFYPAEYGYIENTLDFDGDPLDVLCLVTSPTFPGCSINIRVIGVLKMIDQGQEDHKIIAVPSDKTDPRFSHVKSIEDIGHKKSEIVDFFLNYKNLENKKVFIKGFGRIEEAFKVLKECEKMFYYFEEKTSDGFSREKAIQETLSYFSK